MVICLITYSCPKPSAIVQRDGIKLVERASGYLNGVAMPVNELLI